MATFLSTHKNKSTNGKMSGIRSPRRRWCVHFRGKQARRMIKLFDYINIMLLPAGALTITMCFFRFQSTCTFLNSTL